MKILNVPVSAFAAPFDKVWKRLLMHLAVAVIAGACWMPVYGFYLVVFTKFALFTFFTEVSQSFIHISVHHKLNQRYDWITQTKKRVLSAIFWHLLGTYVGYFTVHALLLHYIF